MIWDFQQTTVASIGLLAQAKTALWRSSQLRRRASSDIAMFPGLSHSSLAYYGAVPLQTKTPPTTTAAAADWRMPTFAHSHCSLSHGRRFAPRAPAPPWKQLSRRSAGRRQMPSPLHVDLVHIGYRCKVTCKVQIQTAYHGGCTSHFHTLSVNSTWTTENSTLEAFTK